MSCWDAQEVLSRHRVWPGTTVDDALADRPEGKRIIVTQSD